MFEWLHLPLPSGGTVSLRPESIQILADVEEAPGHTVIGASGVTIVVALSRAKVFEMVTGMTAANVRKVN